MATDMKILHDTCCMLQQHIDSGTAIALENELGDEVLCEIVHLLEQYELARSRKMTILGCYILIRVAVKKHKELFVQENEKLIRGILDGDYLFGLHYRLVAVRKEWTLLAHLAPFNKKMQIALLAGRPVRNVMNELYEEIRTYLDKQCA
jgi:hypothetical protein